MDRALDLIFGQSPSSVRETNEIHVEIMCTLVILRNLALLI